MWKTHARRREQFFADAAAGTLPPYSWLEPNMLFGELDDYHPPTDIRTGEQFLAAVYDAVRNSPQWESTALLVLFDEHGGCYDHVPPPAAPVPDDSPGEQGFGFDRFGVRVPAIVVSPFTERGTVISDTFHTTSVLRTLRDRFDLGPALTHRDADAPQPRGGLQPLRAPHRRPGDLAAPLHLPPADGGGEEGRLRRRARRRPAHRQAPRGGPEYVSQLGEATLRNAARLFDHDPDDLPVTASGARAWLRERFRRDGRAAAAR